MQKQKLVGQPPRRKRQISFLVSGILFMSYVIVVGSILLLPSIRATAQKVQPQRSSVMNTVVYDVAHNRYTTYNASRQFIAASSMKVPILLTFLDMIERQGRGPTNEEMRLMTIMIENSNNDAASIFYYRKIGGAAGVTRFMQRIGVSGLSPNPFAWGWSLITPLTMVNLLRHLYEGSILTLHDRQLVFYLMEHVQVDQRAGVGDTAPRGAMVALKDGWVPAPDGLWAMNSSGIVFLSGKTYIIAAYTQEEPSLLAGQNDVRQICRKVALQYS